MKLLDSAAKWKLYIVEAQFVRVALELISIGHFNDAEPLIRIAMFSSSRNPCMMSSNEKLRKEWMNWTFIIKLRQNHSCCATCTAYVHSLVIFDPDISVLPRTMLSNFSSFYLQFPKPAANVRKYVFRCKSNIQFKLSHDRNFVKRKLDVSVFIFTVFRQLGKMNNFSVLPF